jgi:hypothetical protein
MSAKKLYGLKGELVRNAITLHATGGDGIRHNVMPIIEDW